MAHSKSSIGSLLDQLKGERFIVLHDIEEAGEGKIDHLVSGPTGVFMIDSTTKKYGQEALKKARRRAAKLHDQLGSWVVPVICINKREQEPFQQGRVWIVPKPHLLDWIRSRHDKPVSFERLVHWVDTRSN